MRRSFNHHCAPNCHYEWNPKLKQMTVHVLCSVAAGQELTLSYLAPSGRVKSERQGMYPALIDEKETLMLEPIPPMTC